VLDDQDRAPGHFVQSTEERNERLGFALGDPGRGLVEEEEPRPRQHDGSEIHHATCAGGEMTCQVVTEASETERLDHVVHRSSLCTFGPAFPGELQAGRDHADGSTCVLVQHQSVVHRELRVQRAVLERANDS